MKLKRCPFCNGESEIFTGERINQNPGFMGQDYFQGRCKECGSKGQAILFDYFATFSKYRVEEFRKDPSLRTREESEYSKYQDSKKNEAVIFWNTRSK